MNTPRFARRCLLFVPGDSRRKLEKATGLNADSLIFDLEDAVPIQQKREARQTVHGAIATLDFGQSERLVRVNALKTPYFQDDIAHLSSLPLDGIVLPKVETPEDLHQAVQHTSLPLYALIESALAIMNLKEIAQATPQLAGLIFGAEDLAADLGASPSPDKNELLFARSAIVTTAVAYGLSAIDMVYTDLHNLDGLALESHTGRKMGYTGKMAIHPRQIAPIQQIFSPTEAEIAQAQAIIDAYEDHIAHGTGVFALHGRMVDRPVVRAAQQIIARARAAGILG